MFGGFVPGSYLARSVYGYFMNGGGNCYVVRIGAERRRADGKRTPKELPAGPHAQLGRLQVRRASRPARRPGEVSVEIADAGGDDPDRRHVQGRREARRRARRGVRPGHRRAAARPTSPPSSTPPRSHPGRGDQPASAVDQAGRPARSPWPSAATGAVPAPRAVSADDYVGDVADRTGFGGLEAIDEVTMLCVPDLMSAYQQGAIDLESVQAVQLGDDRALRADGRPDGDPRPAARA